MRKAIYKIKIPIEDTDEYKEVQLNTRKEVCDLLNISLNNFIYLTSNKKINYSNPQFKHLEGIIIDKQIIPAVDKPIRTGIIDKVEFRQQLLAKVN